MMMDCFGIEIMRMWASHWQCVVRLLESVHCHTRSDYFGGFLLLEKTRTNWYLKSNLDQSGCHVNVKFICMKLSGK